MAPPGGRVLVALSGGPDSVALTYLLREIESRGELHVAGAAHLNHALRDAAGEDEAFCRELAETLSLPFRAETADVRALAQTLRISLEDAGRKARYGFLHRAAGELGADVIATGHTRDDQAETFLLRLIRGAGPRGLAGIFPVSGRVVRPLLEIRRDDLRAYLVSCQRSYREDESNLDLTVPRNRVRHGLLPYLQREFSPGIVEVLAREAELARQDEEYLARKAIETADSSVLTSRTGAGLPAVELDRKALASLHPALASRVARHALALASDRFIGFDHVERLLDFARDPDRTGELTLPGCRVVIRRGSIEVGGQPPQPFANSFRFQLSIPGEVALVAQGWAVSAQPLDEEHSGSGSADKPVGREQPRLSVSVQSGRLPLPLAVRSRRPGDWFRPLGLGGRRRKLQDFLVDRKIPRERRDLLPLVVDGEDRIVWVVGESLAEDFRVTDPSRGVILLKARRLGGEG